MATFKKADLQFTDYSWTTTEGDSARVIGFPDNVLLNRIEGYEVIAFINRFIDGQSSWKDQPDTQKRANGHKLERMIHDKLPGDIRSHLKGHCPFKCVSVASK